MRFLSLNPAIVLRRFAIFFLACVPCGALAAERAPEAPSQPVLHLANGGFVSGNFSPSADSSLVSWEGTPFVTPFRFPLKRIEAVYFPSPAKLPKPAGEFCLKLAGGDVLFGALAGWDDRVVTIDVPLVGRLRLARSRVGQLFRWQDGAGIVYLGPNGLDDWTPQPSSPSVWHNDQGQLYTFAPGAYLEGNFTLPPRAAIELELSWKEKPDFKLALGIGSDDASIHQAYHIEAWEHDLVILRETDRDAEVASLQPISREAGRLRLLIYLDQAAGRCVVYSMKGKLLADLTIAGSRRVVLPGLRLTNKRGDVRLERLQVARWIGGPPRGDVLLDKPRIQLVDGTVQYRQVAAYDPATKEFLLQGDGTTRIAAERVEGVFPPQSETIEGAGAGAGAGTGAGAGAGAGAVQQVTLAYHDSSRFSGSLLKVDKEAIWLASAGGQGALRLPLAGLRSVLINAGTGGDGGGDEPVPLSPSDGSRHGTLECRGVHLQGRLVDGSRTAEASCLVWRPEGSATASALRPDIDGRIVYREIAAPQPEPRAVRGVRRRVVERPLNVGGRIVMGQRWESVESSHELKRRALHLVSGDTIPCEVTRIDQSGVSFTSPLSKSTFVPHSQIKAVELTLDGRGPVSLTRTKRERLLTLPRMQKGNPPTHLVRSRDGDYLRGRIAEMDDKRLVIEVRLETKEIPRERISRIIWLHPEENPRPQSPLTPTRQGVPIPMGPSQSKPSPAEGEGGKDGEGNAVKPSRATDVSKSTRVQALFTDGIRLTFHPETFADETLSGKSNVLGDCKVGVDSVDQLLLGAAIDEAAARAAYQQWKLQYAIEPKFVQDENNKSAKGASSGTGTESALVGKPAPDFELDMLGGDRFHLAAHKGKIVVLDFWATWCSYCLQSMPEVARLHREAPGGDVDVVAVNLEESAEQISAMLERHKWQLPVALDRDGVVAAKYGVTAIPQTVVIDRDGKVIRHFVGGGADLGKNLSESIQGLMPRAGAQKTSTPAR